MPEFPAPHQDPLDLRRAQMLDLLLRKVRTRRRARALTTSAATLVALVLALQFARSPSPAPSPSIATSTRATITEAPSVAVVNADPPPSHPSRGAIQIVQISTDPSILDRTSVSSSTSKIEYLDDATLVASLEPTCGAVGLARVGREVRILGGCAEVYAAAPRHE